MVPSGGVSAKLMLVVVLLPQCTLAQPLKPLGKHVAGPLQDY